jgi:hypothetical protein
MKSKERQNLRDAISMTRTDVNRVTGLGEFSPIGRLLTLGSFFKRQKETFFQVLSLTEKSVGLHFGRFFHPLVRSPCVHVKQWQPIQWKEEKTIGSKLETFRKFFYTCLLISRQRDQICFGIKIKMFTKDPNGVPCLGNISL